MSKRMGLIIIGIVVVAAVVSVLLCTRQSNDPPVIASLEADPERVLPRASCQITCTATDPEGDTLMYGWSADGGTIAGEGDSITWTAPSSAGSYNVTVIVADAQGSAATGHITVTVRTNHAPSIQSLVADADWTLASGSIGFTCQASDSDEDELSYEWSATGGTISGTGPAINWTAPQQVGVYYITVAARDPHGSSATRTLAVSVTTEQPPTIEQLLVTADHCYLKTTASGYTVGKEREFQIECVVADTGLELSYHWSCTGGGEFSGEEGSLVTWLAPGTATDATITVTVSDIAGNVAVKNVVLKVVSCNTCSFPGCSA